MFQFSHVFDQTQDDASFVEATESSRKQVIHEIASQLAAGIIYPQSVVYC